MDEVIEYVDIEWDKDLLESIFKSTLTEYDVGRSYIECGAKSHVMSENKEFETKWKPILDKHYKVHNKVCPLATGFNFNATVKNTVPPHIDVDKPLYFNLLIPVFGVAKLNLFETIPEHLEFRHGLSHWKMQQDGSPRKKIGELIVDKPVLLDTNILHDVEPIDTPRCVWCTRWIDIPQDYTYKTFKQHIENIL